MACGTEQAHRPCPGCGSYKHVYVRQAPPSEKLQAYCRGCGFTMDLKTTLPCSPSAILEEWDRRAAP